MSFRLLCEPLVLMQDKRVVYGKVQYHNRKAVIGASKLESEGNSFSIRQGKHENADNTPSFLLKLRKIE